MKIGSLSALSNRLGVGHSLVHRVDRESRSQLCVFAMKRLCDCLASQVDLPIQLLRDLLGRLLEWS